MHHHVVVEYRVAAVDLCAGAECTLPFAVGLTILCCSHVLTLYNSQDDNDLRGDRELLCTVAPAVKQAAGQHAEPRLLFAVRGIAFGCM